MATRRIAASILQEIDRCTPSSTAYLRALRRGVSKRIAELRPHQVLAIADEICAANRRRWFAYELVLHHPGAFAEVDRRQLEQLGHGIDSWWATDAFARTLSGPAWLRSQVSDATIAAWSRSPDRWWRRVALVSTVALNMRSQGGEGDAPRTLKVCARLVRDHDDMVVKGLFWALRALVAHDPRAVERFLTRHQRDLAGRVLREVRNKLATGRKILRARPSRPSTGVLVSRAGNRDRMSVIVRS